MANSRSRSRARKKGGRRPITGGPKPWPPWPLLLGEGFVWLLLLLLWWVHDLAAAEAFRQPKLLLGQLLVLGSACCLAWRLGEVKHLGGAEFLRELRRPAVVMILPLLLLATLSLFTTDHPHHARAAVTSLLIGTVVLVAWSRGLPRPALERLLAGWMLPALALSLFAGLQFIGLYEPFDFARAGLQEKRMGLTSFAGNAGDLAIFLVLPCLFGQAAALRTQGRRRWAWIAAVAVTAGTIALTQTLSALVAVILGSIVLWIGLLPRRLLLPVFGVLVVIGAVLVLAVTPLRQRVTVKAEQLAKGRVDEVLTGRLDGWRAATWMLSQHPWTGVGHGAYRAEFTTARLALHEQGVEGSRLNRHSMFLNAHSEPLEVAAELGWPGLLVLLWSVGVLAHHLIRLRPKTVDWRPALAWAGCAALALLALAQFPFRVALTALPALLFLAWVFHLKPPELVEEEEAS